MKILFGLFFYFNIFISFAQSDTSLIETVLDRYSFGRNNGDTALLRSSFYDKADLRYIDSKTGDLVILSLDNYLKRFNSGEKLPCTAHIEYINIFGTVAQAKLILKYADRSFADYFNLVKGKNGWLIASKSFAPIRNTKKILFIITSHAEFDEHKTGLHFAEFAKAYMFFIRHGFQVDVSAPNGNNKFLYGFNLNDSSQFDFLTDPAAIYSIKHPLKLDSLLPENYIAVYLPGGHGCMWDFKENQHIQRLIAGIWKQGGVVSAVCHGPAGILDVKMDGKYLVEGRKISAFSNTEENATGLSGIIPFFLETELQRRGALIFNGPKGVSNVVADGKLITGQNPSSVQQVCEKMLQAINSIK